MDKIEYRHWHRSNAHAKELNYIGPENCEFSLGMLIWDYELNKQ